MIRHKLTNIKDDTADCSVCGQGIKIRPIRSAGTFLRWECRTRHNEINRNYDKSERGKKNRKSYYQLAGRRAAGIKDISEEILEKYNSATCCEICKTPRSDCKQFHIDHCHKYDLFRGFLCQNCNLGLGFFKDSVSNLEEAISYLKSKTASIEAVLPN